MTDFQDLHHEQAIAAFDRGNLSESIEHFRKAIEQQPGNPDLHFNLAIVLDGNGEVNSAGAEFREALRLSPADASMHLGLGAHFLKTEQWDRAVVSFQQAIQMRPGWPDALTYMGIALGRKAKASRQNNDHRAYLDVVEQMLSLFPEQLLWRENRAWVLWKMNRRSEALAEAERLLSLEPTPRSYARLLHYQRRLGRWRDFSHTIGTMVHYTFRKAIRRVEWEQTVAGDTKEEDTKQK